MRDSIVNCFKNTIIFKYNLPNDELAIDKSVYTTDLDYCYESADDSKLEEIIYNSIIDYAFNDEEFENENLDELHIEALSQRVRIEDTDSDETKERYGIYGEVLLNLILRIYYETDMIISKGYFYDILKPEENKGYDSFHLIERSTETSLWFGEVKFYQNYKSALNSIFSNIINRIEKIFFCPFYIGCRGTTALHKPMK